uniref:Uncharacterized protein n=1 Tax=Rhizophora mucronata TaxID=61149 RepID=A0A2P2LUU1_RHIMU
MAPPHSKVEGLDCACDSVV